MFCTSCGKQIEDGSVFCEHCGARQETAAQQPASPQSAAPGTGAGPAQPVQPQVETIQPPIGGGAPQNAAPRKPMSKKTKIILGAVAGVIVLVVALKLILSSVFSADNTITKFINAVRERDADGVRSVATVYLDQMELTDESLEPFFDAFSADNATLVSWQENLLEQKNMQQYQQAMAGMATSDSSSVGMLTLVDNSNILFDSYKIQIRPVNLSLYCGYDGTTVTFGNLEPMTVTNSTSVTILPGQYDISASCTAESTGAELTMEDSGRFTYDDSYDIYFDTADMEIEAYSYVTITGITIDGAPYTGEIEDGMYAYLSPLNYGSEVVVTGDCFGETFEETFIAGDSYYVSVSYNPSEEVILMASDEASQIAYDLVMALEGHDADSMAALQAQYPDNEAVAAIQTYFDNNAASTYTDGAVFTSLEAGDCTVSAWAYSTGIQLEVQVEMTASGTDYYYWSDYTEGTGEGTPFTDETFTVTIDFTLADGELTFTDYYYWFYV